MTSSIRTDGNAGAHTPGPWEWDAGIIPPDGPERYADIYADDEIIIASFNDQIPEGRANARLIAAAPDLLKAAKRALVTLKAQGESIRPGNVLGALEAAIKSATGERP